jgi:hypothetical protein
MRNLLNKQPEKYRDIMESLKPAEDYACGNCIHCSSEARYGYYSEHVCEKTGEPVESWQDSSNCKYFFT